MESNSDRSFILVIALGLIGAVIIGAIIIVSLTRPAQDSEAGAQTTAEVTAEGTPEVTGEATAEATSEATQAAAGEATAEATEAGQAQGEATAEPSGEAGGQAGMGDGGAPTPTSMSRVTASILIGTEVTLAPISGGDVTQAASGGGESGGEPTPTSLSRVTQSITLGGAQQAATPAASGGTGAESTPEATPEASAEATSEATAEAVAMAGGGQQGGGGGDDQSRPLPTPVPGRPRGAPSALETAGPVAEQIGTQWWVMIILATIIYAYVMLLLLSVVRNRNANVQEDEDSPGRQRNFIALNGFAMPIVTLSVVFAFTVGTLSSFSNQATDLTVEVIGRQWWWEVRYPDHNIVTANEIHIPAGQKVRFVLESADVIHSFWVPELGGKLDLIPGRTNSFWLQADQPGEYRGQCAEFCGLQHAKMAFLIIADTPDTFQDWLAQQQQPAVEPSSELLRQGHDVFVNGQCDTCHTIRGTDASGVQGPDLTHLASRRTIGAATLPNNTGHLAGWIVDSQAIKPGNKMPPQDVTGQDLQALLAYLNSLQ